MAKTIALFVLYYAGAGIISWGTPRLLVALGVPLDKWIIALGAGLTIRLNRNVALWGATVVIGIVLYGTATILLLDWSSLPHITQTGPNPPTASPKPSTTVGPRRYTDKTAGELVTFFVGRTTLQANKLIEEEVGKWLKVRGTFKNAFTNNSQGDLTVFIREGSAVIQCNFPPQSADRIKDLRDGDPIAIEGQIISNQLGNPFWLMKCEFD